MSDHAVLSVWWKRFHTIACIAITVLDGMDEAMPVLKLEFAEAPAAGETVGD